MSGLDTLMFDWFGDTLVVVLVFNFLLAGPASFATGQGLATKAVASVRRIAFGRLGLHRIEAGTLERNVRSQRVLERNGFERFGLAPRYLRIDGRWQDHILFQVINDH